MQLNLRICLRRVRSAAWSFFQLAPESRESAASRDYPFRGMPKQPKRPPVPPTEDDTKLVENDSRYYMIAPHGEGSVSVASTERLWKNEPDVHFAFPSQPALFLSLARRAFEMAAAVDQRAIFVPWHGAIAARNATELFDYFENLMSHLIFSFNAIEAFANWKIPEDYIHKTVHKGMAVTRQRTEILERSTLEEKLAVILPAILNVKSPKGTRVWERFVDLKRMRDRITHPKPADYEPTLHGIKANTIWGMMMRDHSTPHCDYAHDLIGHYGANHRWFRQYPVRTVEVRNMTDE